jgi:2'-5' RNA ligase
MALDGCRIRYDDKPFQPHLTLVRIRESWRDADVALFQATLERAGPLALRLGRVALFESRLLRSEAEHIELASFPLD